MTITLKDMYNKPNDVNVETIMEIVSDLWDAFNKKRHANIVESGLVNDYDVEKFQNWTKQNGYDTISKYLPNSTTQLSEIIRHCINKNTTLAY